MQDPVNRCQDKPCVFLAHIPIVSTSLQRATYSNFMQKGSNLQPGRLRCHLKSKSGGHTDSYLVVVPWRFVSPTLWDRSSMLSQNSQTWRWWSHENLQGWLYLGHSNGAYVDKQTPPTLSSPPQLQGDMSSPTKPHSHQPEAKPPMGASF